MLAHAKSVIRAYDLEENITGYFRKAGDFVRILDAVPYKLNYL